MAWIKLFVESDGATTQKSVLSVSLQKQGERSVDQIKIRLPPNESVGVNDKLLYLQDNVDITNLVAIYNFQGGAKDESGQLNHGTTSNITYGTDKWDGKSATFNGTNGKVTITDDNTLDFSAKFDIVMWLKWTATTSPMYVVSKRSATSNGWAICVNRTTAGDVAFHIGSSVVTSSTAGYNDGEWHMVRIKRDADNLVTLYVDNTSKGTMTNSTNLTDTNNLVIGYDTPATSWFAGSVARFRLYKGGLLSDDRATQLYTNRNPRSTLKFGGYVTKIEKELGHKDVIAQSFGKVLAEIEVRGQLYDDKTPEYIINDLITRETSLTYSDEGSLSGLTLETFNADGKLIDIVRNLATYTNKIFYTTANEDFFFIPRTFKDTTILFTHGVGAKISSNGFDDTEIVNDLTVLGENKRYETNEAFDGDGSQTVFTLLHNAIVPRVQIGPTGVYNEVHPEQDYELDSDRKTITFLAHSVPVSGTDNVVVYYMYEIPLFFRGKKNSSIEKYGVHAKRLNMPWIKNRTDGVRFVQSYLNRYKDVQEKIQVNVANLYNSAEEGDVIEVVNDIKGINGTFTIKSIKWDYPQMTTTLEVGEYYFGFFEADKQIVEKLHNVENALTIVKDIREYESPEEVLGLTDVVVIQVNQELTESLSITDSDHVYELSTDLATWGLSTYGSRGKGAPSGKVYTSG